MKEGRKKNPQSRCCRQAAFNFFLSLWFLLIALRLQVISKRKKRKRQELPRKWGEKKEKHFTSYLFLSTMLACTYTVISIFPSFFSSSPLSSFCWWEIYYEMYSTWTVVGRRKEKHCGRFTVKEKHLKKKIPIFHIIHHL